MSVDIALLSGFVLVAVTWFVVNKLSYDRGFREGADVGFRHGYFSAGGKHDA